MIQREHWGSRFGFIMATAGFAVGLGNIWRFPYVVGENGGAAFLVLYLVFAILIGIPLLTAELSMGRKAQLSPIDGMARLVGRHSPWMLFPWLGVVTTFLIISTYAVLLSWIANYLAMIALGSFPTGTSAEIEAAFGTFVSRPGPVIGGAAALMALCGLLVSRSLTSGLERVAKFAMPALLVMLVLLAARSLTFDGARQGIVWYLQPDFAELTGASVLTALGQAFFSIGVGVTSAFGLGSYLDPETSDVPGNAAIVVGCDTLIALVAGLVIFPALFAFGIAPDSGPTLLFATMPVLFDNMPTGLAFGAVFMLLLLIAGLTSVIAALEVVASIAHDSLGWSRKRAVGLVATAWFFISIPVALSQGPWSHLRLFGRDLFGGLDFLVGNYLVPIGGLMVALYVATSWGWIAFRDETNEGSGRVKVNPTWKPFIQFLIPVAVVIVLLTGWGVF
jgi:NSS family neurotransmitter:Na+ symporter